MIEQHLSEGIPFDLETIAIGLGMSYKQANMLLKQQSAISLDAEDTEGNALMDTIPSGSDVAEDELEQQEASSTHPNKILRLSRQSRTIYPNSYFGLDGNPKQTMRETVSTSHYLKNVSDRSKSKPLSDCATCFNKGSYAQY